MAAWLYDGNSAAIFLDRDGVLVEDAGLVTQADQFTIMTDVPVALDKLKRSGYKLVGITNQAVVARGLVSEAEAEALNARLDQMLQVAGGPPLDGWFLCPHHPKATLPAYRQNCECRKPAPGMLLRAARDHNIELEPSYMVGDRLTDIMAGKNAGCRTVLVETGKHDAPLIETSSPLDIDTQADHVCDDLPAATRWILSQS